MTPTSAEIQHAKTKRRGVQLYPFPTSKVPSSHVKTIEPFNGGRELQTDAQSDKKFSAADHEHASRCIWRIRNNLVMNNSEWAEHWAKELCDSPYASQLGLVKNKDLLKEIRVILTDYKHSEAVAPILIPMLLEHNLAKTVWLVAANRTCPIPVRELAVLSLAENGGAHFITTMSAGTFSLALKQSVARKLRELGMQVPKEWSGTGADHSGDGTEFHDEQIHSSNSRRNGRPGRRKVEYGNGAGENVLVEPPQKEESNSAIFNHILSHIHQGMLDDAKDLLNGRKEKLVEWLKSDEMGAKNIARQIELKARVHCNNVPNQAKFLIDLLAEAKRFANIRNIAERSSINMISKYARKCLK